MCYIAVSVIEVRIRCHYYFFFFFQAEDGIRDDLVTGVQTCALPIYKSKADLEREKKIKKTEEDAQMIASVMREEISKEIGRASCRERV